MRRTRYLASLHRGWADVESVEAQPGTSIELRLTTATVFAETINRLVPPRVWAEHHECLRHGVRTLLNGLVTLKSGDPEISPLDSARGKPVVERGKQEIRDAISSMAAG
jgi:hypothetical protein